LEAASHAHDHHHDMPTSGGALSRVAVSATLHCLTGCAIGEIVGMAVGTALGFSEWGTVALAVALAFLFGYTLTSLPLLRAGLTVAAVVPIALASDTFSIAVMEVVDNAIMLTIPGAMESGLDSWLFWGALSVALVVAGIFAFPVNRWLIARGKGHAVVHETGIHGGPSPKVVGIVAAFAAVFGTTVLVAEVISSGGDSMGHGDTAAQESGGHGEGSAAGGGHGEGSAGGKGSAAGGGHGEGSEPDPVRGLTARADGLTLRLATAEIPRGERAQLRFRVVGDDGQPVRDFEIEHEKRMHLILARRDLTGFQHLHPRMSADGTWTTPVTVPEAGSYRVFADFKHDGRNQTLAHDLTVEGTSAPRPLPAAAATAATDDGYRVRLRGGSTRAGEAAKIRFEVTHDGEPVALQDYLGAKGHLVALRQGDLAYLHTHPVTHDQGHPGEVGFETEFPSDGRYRLFLQFRHDGEVRTAAFTREVAR
jgi:Domain of unknown function (DUF4396)